jgi:SAM-dependent methyltransferase
MSTNLTEAMELDVKSGASIPQDPSINAEPGRRFEVMNFKQKILSRPCVDRERHIEELLQISKSALHVGCTDAPFTDALLHTGDLLHHRLLTQSPQKVVGFDISLKNLHALQRAYPQSKFVHGDAERLQSYFTEQKFDLIIAGEILEHLSNPGLFFESCRQVLTENGILLLTVPNVFGIRRLIHNVLSTENYHPDHTFYFSENTLKTLAGRYGFGISNSFYYASNPGNSLVKTVLYAIVERLPAFLLGSHFLEGLVLELKKTDS